MMGFKTYEVKEEMCCSLGRLFFVDRMYLQFVVRKLTHDTPLIVFSKTGNGNCTSINMCIRETNKFNSKMWIKIQG
jgi:hypothetical protein